MEAGPQGTAVGLQFKCTSALKYCDLLCYALCSGKELYGIKINVEGKKETEVPLGADG